MQFHFFSKTCSFCGKPHSYYTVLKDQKILCLTCDKEKLGRFYYPICNEVVFRKGFALNTKKADLDSKAILGILDLLDQQEEWERIFQPTVTFQGQTLRFSSEETGTTVFEADEVHGLFRTNPSSIMFPLDDIESFAIRPVYRGNDSNDGNYSPIQTYHHSWLEIKLRQNTVFSAAWVPDPENSHCRTSEEAYREGLLPVIHYLTSVTGQTESNPLPKIVI